MLVLIDTHLLLWALSAPSKLSKLARAMIDTSEVYVSAASIWEIGIKSALGKLSADPVEVLAAIEPAGVYPFANSWQPRRRHGCPRGNSQGPFRQTDSSPGAE